MFRPNRLMMPLLLTSIAFGGCRCIENMATDTTSQVLKRGKPNLNQEADYELAARALPATLKTLESFHYARPNSTLKKILIEAYCQYGSGFVEDEWEVAWFEEKAFDRRDYQAGRATKMFIRCSNYALELLGGKWKSVLNGDLANLKAVAKKAGKGQRFGLLWLAAGLTSIINVNLDDPGVVSYLPFSEYMLRRLIIMDGDGYVLEPKNADANAPKKYPAEEYGKVVGPPKNPMERALPHFALARVLSSRGENMGGDPEQGRRHFERALEVTDNKFLLAKVYFARDYCRNTLNRELFHKTLVEVLQTDPAIWPEERLANEIAHRRARRYLKMEKEWF